MSRGGKVTEFISFCIEAFAQSKKMSGAAVSSLLTKTGGIDYLRNGYDVLHTMGREWLVEDLVEFLRLRGIAA